MLEFNLEVISISFDPGKGDCGEVAFFMSYITGGSI